MKVCIALLVVCLAVSSWAQFPGNWPYWGNTAWNNPAWNNPAWNPYWNGYTAPYVPPVDARFAAQPYGWNWPNGAYNRYYGQSGYFGYYGPNNGAYNPTGAYDPNGIYNPTNVARSPVNPWGMPWATYGGAYNNYVREPSATGTRHIAATPGSLHIVG